MDKSISHPEFGWVMIASSNCLRDTLSTMEELSRYGKVEECIFSSNPREREQFQRKGFQNLENKMVKTQESMNKDLEELKNKHAETNNKITEIKNILEGITNRISEAEE